MDYHVTTVLQGSKRTNNDPVKVVKVVILQLCVGWFVCLLSLFPDVPPSEWQATDISTSLKWSLCSYRVVAVIIQ